MKNKNIKQKGFSLIEVVASMVLLGLITVNVITMFGEIDKTNSKIDRKLDTKDLYQRVKINLKDPSICLANFKDLNSNTGFNSTEFFLNAAKSLSFKSLDPNFDRIILKLDQKTQLYENNYVAELEIIGTKLDEVQLKIPIFFKLLAGNISNCSTILNSTGKVSSSVCDVNNIGATQLSAPDPLAYGYVHTLICDGTQWTPADPSGGMFARYMQNGNQCKTPNPITGTCDCPSGYKMNHVLGFANQGNCNLHDGISDRVYDEATDTTIEIPVAERTENCGWSFLSCIPNTIN